MPGSAQLALWQLISSTLPVGAYNYSEGLEWLVERGTIGGAEPLQSWLAQELQTGAIRVETAVMARAHNLVCRGETVGTSNSLAGWNQWLTATRETKELRQQSLQMGGSLRRLLLDLNPAAAALFADISPPEPCHYPIAFGVGAALGQIDLESAGRGYLHSWVNNLISAGVRLIPLGQTAGQRLLCNLGPLILEQSEKILALTDDELYSCNWGLGLASMNHESQYTRLFRS